MSWMSSKGEWRKLNIWWNCLGHHSSRFCLFGGKPRCTVWFRGLEDSHEQEPLTQNCWGANPVWIWMNIAMDLPFLIVNVRYPITVSVLGQEEIILQKSGKWWKKNSWEVNLHYFQRHKKYPSDPPLYPSVLQIDTWGHQSPGSFCFTHPNVHSSGCVSPILQFHMETEYSSGFRVHSSFFSIDPHHL